MVKRKCVGMMFVFDDGTVERWQESIAERVYEAAECSGWNDWLDDAEKPETFHIPVGRGRIIWEVECKETGDDS